MKQLQFYSIDKDTSSTHFIVLNQGRERFKTSKRTNTYEQLYNMLLLLEENEQKKGGEK